MNVLVLSLTLIFSCLAFSACNKSAAADEAARDASEMEAVIFSLSSLVEAFLELAVDVMEAALEDKEGDGSLAMLFLVGKGGPCAALSSGGDSLFDNFDLELDRWPPSRWS